MRPSIETAMARNSMVAASLRVALATLVCLVANLTAAAEKSAVLAAASTITAKESKTHVDVLADDSFEGREANSRGGRAAGGYLVEELRKLGLKGLGDDGSFFQSYAGGRNILAYLEGSDPKLKKQYVMLGAHYDHVGYGSRSNSFGPTGYIHNGADDNASGVAGLLEIIGAYTALPQPPQRSVVFALWDGEEKGLLGSKHWLSSPTIPTSSVVLYINLDMIGRMRNSRVEVYGTRTSYGLRSLVSRQNTAANLQLDFTWEMKDNSDHYPFYERGIPSMMFHTGLHENYHRPSDDAHLINNDGIEQLARLVFNFSYDVADSDRKLGFRGESRREDPAARRAFERTIGQPGPRLGVQWQTPAAGESGVTLIKVTRGLPGDLAGLKTGDRLLKFNGEPVTGDMSLRMAVLLAQPEVTVEVQREGEEQPLTLPIKLAGSPLRLGIGWRDDPADPSTAMLTQVVYGSPAYAAGLRERDRIYEIGGRTFQTTDDFLKLATTLPAPVEVVAERAGVLQRFTIELPKTMAETSATPAAPSDAAPKDAGDM